MLKTCIYLMMEFNMSIVLDWITQDGTLLEGILLQCRQIKACEWLDNLSIYSMFGCMERIYSAGEEVLSSLYDSESPSVASWACRGSRGICVQVRIHTNSPAAGSV